MGNWRNLIRDFLSGIGPDLAQRGMVVRDAHELLGSGAEVHGYDDFVDQFGGFGSYDGGSQDLASLDVT